MEAPQNGVRVPPYSATRACWVSAPRSETAFHWSSDPGRSAVQSGGRSISHFSDAASKSTGDAFARTAHAKHNVLLAAQKPGTQSCSQREKLQDHCVARLPARFTNDLWRAIFFVKRVAKWIKCSFLFTMPIFSPAGRNLGMAGHAPPRPRART